VAVLGDLKKVVEVELGEDKLWAMANINQRRDLKNPRSVESRLR
jgi:hypothetical protein